MLEIEIWKIIKKTYMAIKFKRLNEIDHTHLSPHETSFEFFS